MGGPERNRGIPAIPWGELKDDLKAADNYGKLAGAFLFLEYQSTRQNNQRTRVGAERAVEGFAGALARGKSPGDILCIIIAI